jgi:CubicO group peptidase (beta-lactamase class C family)
MKMNKGGGFCWALAVAAYLSVSTPALVLAQPEIPEDSTQALEQIRDKYNLPGLAVAVVKDGKICDRAAVGVRKTSDGTPVTTVDHFHVGSCTKSMTATLAAMFIENGQLRWDTTVTEVFPGWKGKMDKQYETVTVEQLLTHRGGIPGEPPWRAWLSAWQENGTPTQQREQFIQAVLAQPPAVAPGAKMIYSNQGYAIIGAMLEKISGQSWESLITDKLFKPLNMASAGFGPPGATGKVDQPWGHSLMLSLRIPSQKDNPPAIAPAGRVHCSLDDLARYAVFQMEGERKDGLLKAETMRRLHTPPEGSDYAGGWFCFNRDWAGGRALWHNGSNTLWYMSMWLAPEKNFAVIIATNIGGSDAEKGADEVTRMMVGKWLEHHDEKVE